MHPDHGGRDGCSDGQRRSRRSQVGTSPCPNVFYQRGFANDRSTGDAHGFRKGDTADESGISEAKKFG